MVIQLAILLFFGVENNARNLLFNAMTRGTIIYEDFCYDDATVNLHILIISLILINLF